MNSIFIEIVFQNLALRNLRGHGEVLFFTFLAKLGDKAFMPLSAYGQEVFEILNGCLTNDPSMIEKWKGKFQKHLKESSILLNYLGKFLEDTISFCTVFETFLASMSFSLNRLVIY